MRLVAPGPKLEPEVASRLGLPLAPAPAGYVVICFGLGADRIRRQPWHVAHGLAEGLARLGHRVRVITDVENPPEGTAYEVTTVTHLAESGRLSPVARRAVRHFRPERAFLVTGALGLARMQALRLGVPTFLLIASPRLGLGEILRLGPRTLWRERELLLLPLLNALLPGWMLCRGYARSRAAGLVYLSEAARQRYERLGLPSGHHLVPQVEAGAVPESATQAGPPVIAYLGPPLALRGADLVLDAFERLVAAGTDARLLLLLRPDGDPEAMAAFERRIARSPCRGRIQCETRMLAADALRQRLKPVRVFLLPFRITISEVPLVVIEAGLSGRPVVTLDTPGVGEYARALGGIVAPDAASLPVALRLALDLPASLPRPDPAPWTSWEQEAKRLVSSPSRPLDGWRMIALAGADGSGKTFLLRRLQAMADAEGLPCRHVWSRFRNYLSKPLLALTRLTGHNRKLVIDGVRVGRHAFASPPLLAYGFLLLQIVDNVLDILIRFRLRGRTLLLADRCIYDTLVDWCVDTGRDDLILDRIGPLLVALLPRPHLAVVLERDLGLVQRDRPDALLDRDHDRRRSLFARLARRYNLPIVTNDGTPEQAIAAILGIRPEAPP